jgi:hypothetical protein
MSDLEKVIPSPVTVTVTVDGQQETVLVNQIKVGQLPDVLRVSHRLLPAVEDGKFDPKVLFMEHTDDILDLIAICTKKSRDWVDNLDVPDGINLFVTVLEVNLDFFVQNVLPSLLQATAAISGVVKEVGRNTRGQLPSSTSSPKDTATPTS